MKKAAIITYGCQMNVNDSSKIKTVLTGCGYQIQDEIEGADLVILNTCTIREGASEKVYGKLGELKFMKKKNKKMLIGVAGCLAQEKKNEIIETNPCVDIVIGNQNIHRLPEYIAKLEAHTYSHIVLTDREDELPPRIDAEFDSKITANISITYGCNNFCSYCIVPYVRGRERSVPVENVIKEVSDYLDKGYKEIVLLGQNVNSYGKDLKNVNFSLLLREIVKIEKKFRLRFMSPHPRDFSDELIETIASNDKICTGIHLPIQAGSTKVLKDMNRGYTKEQYLDLVSRIKKQIPDAGITTDIIVGFPGETEEDFLDTLDVVKKARFENAYMFMYSVRSGTKAETMSDHIDEETKNNRLKRLMEMQNQIAKEESQKYLGKTLEVLVEGTTRKNENMYTGRTSSSKIVIFKADKDLEGEFVNVKINDAKTWTIYGDIV